MSAANETVAAVAVRFFAAAEEAAGTAGSTYEASDVGALRIALTSAHPALAGVLPRCAILVDGVRSPDDAPLGDGATVDILPPFAGG